MIGKYIFYSALIINGLAALDDPSVAKLIDNQLEHGTRGHYYFRFESSDGIVREEEGAPLDEHLPDSPVIVKGSYSYADPTGKIYTVRYIADENGFHPEGPHIQVPQYVANPSTVRPYVQASPQPLYIPAVTTPRADEPTRVQIPLERRKVKEEVLDEGLRGAIVDILANGVGQGFRVNRGN